MRWTIWRVSVKCQTVLSTLYAPGRSWPRALPSTWSWSTTVTLLLAAAMATRSREPASAVTACRGGPCLPPVGPSSAQLYAESAKAKTLQSSFSGPRNGFVRPGRSSARFSECDKQISLQKIISNGAVRRSLSGVSRNNCSSQVSDEDKMLRNTPSEAKRLLTTFGNGGTGFNLARDNPDSLAGTTNTTWLITLWFDGL